MENTWETPTNPWKLAARRMRNFEGGGPRDRWLAPRRIGGDSPLIKLLPLLKKRAGPLRLVAESAVLTGPEIVKFASVNTAAVFGV